MHKQVDCASYVQEFCNNIKAIYASRSSLCYFTTDQQGSGV